MTGKNTKEPNQKELKRLTETLIRAQSTMTLATAKGDEAWAAPVYYVFLKSCFYFFSDPGSRHIEESLGSGKASSAIHVPADTWQGIRGLQISGKIEIVSSKLETVEAIRAYLKRFPFTRDFFESEQDLDLGAFAKRFKVRLYKFVPSLIYYLDNSIRFGFREEVKI